jgi:hypothetical protein
MAVEENSIGSAAKQGFQRRRTGCKAAGWLFSALVAFPIDARCGAPFVTDDPGTVAPARAEVLLFYQTPLMRLAERESRPTRIALRSSRGH